MFKLLELTVNFFKNTSQSSLVALDIRIQQCYYSADLEVIKTNISNIISSITYAKQILVKLSIEL